MASSVVIERVSSDTLQALSEQGRTHLLCAYPQLEPLFANVGSLSYPMPSGLHLLDAMARVINSQMLSTHAARAILTKLVSARDQSESTRIADLPEETLRECGWSRGKVRTMKEFRLAYSNDPVKYETWPTLSFDELTREVDTFWGISTWTAEMLGIFHFGHTDVLPRKDLAVNRAIENLSEKYGAVDRSAASPHGTLMALYMWESYRSGFWDETSDAIG